MSTDTPSPATPAPADRGDRMSTPTPDRPQWSVTVTVPADLPGGDRVALADRIAAVAHDWEPAERDGWDVDVSAGPAASAPQGDTADVIERARCVLAESYDGIDPDVETRHDGAVANLAAAGLLAVAASPAPESLDLEALAGACRAYVSAWDDRHADSTVLGSLAGRVALAAPPAAPQAAGEAERWKQAYALKLAEFTRETLRVSAALRICNDRYRTGSGEGGLGYSMAQDDVRKAIESVPAVPASSTPAPADDEAALVERMAAAIAKDDGFDWRSGEWNDVYLSRARAALAELKRGQKA